MQPIPDVLLSLSDRTYCNIKFTCGVHPSILHPFSPQNSWAHNNAASWSSPRAYLHDPFAQLDRSNKLLNSSSINICHETKAPKLRIEILILRTPFYNLLVSQRTASLQSNPFQWLTTASASSNRSEEWKRGVQQRRTKLWSSVRSDHGETR